LEDRPVDPREYQSPTKLFCRSCGAVNPPKAYCCITCFKVLRPKQKLTFWQLAMKPSVSVVVFFAVLVVVGLFAMKKWIDKIEGRFHMDLKTADYNISVVAGKQKKGLVGAPQSNEFTDIDAKESGHSVTGEPPPPPPAPKK